MTYHFVRGNLMIQEHSSLIDLSHFGTKLDNTILQDIQSAQKSNFNDAKF